MGDPPRDNTLECIQINDKDGHPTLRISIRASCMMYQIKKQKDCLDYGSVNVDSCRL